MKLENYIKNSLQEYPLLYKCGTYEESRIHVLGHLFLTNGNGIDWAHTENVEDGGYMTVGRYKSEKYDHERKFDKPYNKRQRDIKLPDDYFDTILLRFMSEYKYIETLSKKNGDIQLKIKQKKDSRMSDALRYMKKFLVENSQDSPYSPYPVSDGYAAITDIMSGRQKFIQDDWMQGAIEIAQYSLDFYKDKKNKHSYDFERSFNRETRHFEDTFKKEGVDGVKRLRKIWSYKDNETIEEHCKRVDREHREKQTKFFTKFLNKFDN